MLYKHNVSYILELHLSQEIRNLVAWFDTCAVGVICYF